MIRWHGKMIGIGFWPRAAPTARAASGCRIPRATAPYVETSPNGTLAVSAMTFRTKGDINR